MSERAEMSLAELQAKLEASPFHQLFHMEVVEADGPAARLTIRQGYTPSVERAPGSRQYHGGVIASLIDITGDYALIYLLGIGIPTINFRVDYLRTAIDTDLTATASVRKIGRTVGVVDIEVTDDRGRLIALGRGCYGTRSG